MSNRRPFYKNGRAGPPRGVKLARKQRFEPKLSTKSGVNVRSQYEVRCADFLHAAGIEFQYEPLMLLAGRQVRPDFFLPAYNLFLELCGYNHMPHYVDRVREKEELYRKHGLHAVFVRYNGRGSLEKLVRAELEAAGVSFAGET